MTHQYVTTNPQLSGPPFVHVTNGRKTIWFEWEQIPDLIDELISVAKEYGDYESRDAWSTPHPQVEE